MRASAGGASGLDKAAKVAVQGGQRRAQVVRHAGHPFAVLVDLALRALGLLPDAPDHVVEGLLDRCDLVAGHGHAENAARAARSASVGSASVISGHWPTVARQPVRQALQGFLLPLVRQVAAQHGQQRGHQRGEQRGHQRGHQRGKRPSNTASSVAMRAPNEHRRSPILARRLRGGSPGPRLHPVEQHQIPALAVDGGHRVAAVGLAVQALGGLLQLQAQRVDDGVIVFNQQQVLGRR